MKKKENKKTTMIKSESNTKKKVATDEPTLSKKDFRETPAVEKLYKTINEFKLREEAYKTAIEIYLNLKKK